MKENSPMHTSDNEDLLKMVEGVRQFSLNLSKSVKPFRWIGYGLLILAILDWVTLLIPPNLMNPAWEFQTIGALVERAPVVLLAFLLVFYGKTAFRAEWEELLVKILSWVCLVLGILFFLFAPLGIVNTVRINAQNNAQLGVQYEQKIAQATQLEQQLNQATVEELQQLVASQGETTESSDSQNLRGELLSQLTEAKQSFEAEFAETKANQKLALFKNSLKWNLGAIIVGTALVYLWRTSSWTRE
jgi:hypothetical protein